MFLETIEQRRSRLTREHIARVAGQMRREHWERKRQDAMAENNVVPLFPQTADR